jgi:cytochrome P450
VLRELPDTPQFFATQDPKVHSFLRKRVAAAYSMSAILGLEPVIGNVLSTVWSVFDDATEDGRAVDLGLWTTYFASDVVGSLGIGGPIGFVEKRGDVHDMIKSIHRVFYFSALFGKIPGQMWWFRNALSQYVLSLVAGDGANGGAKFQAWLYNQCKNRADCPEIKDRRKDMLDHFISMKDHEGKQVTLPDVMMEAGNLIGAGADTTAAAISTVLGQLLNHPANYKRLQEEVDAAFAAMPNGSDHQLDYKTAETLPWLTACIKEGTRLMPSIVWNLPREAPSEGITIAGYYIPRSATLSISPVSHNRLKQVFGDDADEWSPSRYMIGENGTTEERLRMMEKYNVTVSLAASYFCLSRTIADYLQVRLWL